MRANQTVSRAVPVVGQYLERYIGLVLFVVFLFLCLFVCFAVAVVYCLFVCCV